MNMDPFGLWNLATGDAGLIAQCRSRTRRLFLLAGLGTGIVYMITPFSLYLLFEQAFQFDAGAWLMALLFSAVLLNIYRLTLASVHVNDLPGSSARRGSRIASLALRSLFITGLAFFLSAPLATAVFKETGERIAAEYRATLRSELESLFTAHLARIQQQRAAASASGDDARSLQLASEEKKFTHETDRRIAALKGNRFFIKRIQELYRIDPRTWLLTVAIGVLFVLPILMKTLAVNRGDHRVLVRAYETDLIEGAFFAFRDEYHRLFKEHALLVSWQSTYSDPPFNTVPPVRPEAKDQEAFKTWMKDVPWP